jgi:hypothetical protein
MRAKVKRDSSQQVLTRVLDAFAQELIDTSDEEILEAAQDLGMDLGMKGSAAFLGVIHPTPRQLSDFFDVEEVKRLLAMSGGGRIVGERPVKPKSGSGRPRLSSERKPSNGK